MMVCSTLRCSFWLVFVAAVFAPSSSLAFGVTKEYGPKTAPLTSRRRILETFVSTALSTVVGIPICALPARAEFIGSPPMVREWPELQYLVPLYEMESSLAVLESLLDPSNGRGSRGVALASNLVERFLSGGLISNKNIYKGLCVIYTQEIQHDDPDRGRVRDHKLAFLDDCDMTISGMEAMRKPLKKLADKGAEEASAEVKSSLSIAREGMRRFLSRIPAGDIDRIRAWYKAVKAADADENGKVEGVELNALSEEDAKVYKAVGDLLG